MRALIVIDMQNDFLPGGALAVPSGDAILPVVNRLAGAFPVVVATQDWHPPGHMSFASRHPGRKPLETVELEGLEQTLWPDHCVWNTPGAAFAEALDLGPVAAIFRKGMDPTVDSYSGFFDNARRHQTGMAGYLRGLGVTELFLTGLTADFCVAFTAADAVELGFGVTVVEDATKALDPVAYETKRKKLQERGVRFDVAERLID